MSWSIADEEKIRRELLRIDPRFKKEIYSGYFYRRTPSSLSNFYMRESLAYLKALYNRNIKILDYGCGVGTFLFYLWKHRFYNLHGADTSRGFLNAAVKLQRAFKASFPLQTVDPNDIYAIAGTFDVITLGEFDVIAIFDFLHEKRFRLPLVFDNVAMALKPNGTFLFSLQNWTKNPKATRAYYSTEEILKMTKAAGFRKETIFTRISPGLTYSLYIMGI